MNNCIMVYGNKELEKISEDRLKLINNYATIENKKYMNTYVLHQNGSHLPINTTSSPIIRPNKEHVYYIKGQYRNTLEKKILYKANTKLFTFQTETEKMLFICNGIFRDDEKFLETLKNMEILPLLNQLISSNNDLEARYSNNLKLATLQKNYFYRIFFKQHKDELQNLLKYFYEFHKVTNLNIIINKLSQINFFNYELYQQYINTENKCITKKVNHY